MSHYERKSSPIRELMNDPDINQMTGVLTKNTEGLHSVVPNIAQSLQVTGSRAINYLHAKMPKPANEMIGDAEYEPSKVEQHQWMHTHDIVNDPVSVLDHVRHGTLTPAHMEALSTVHPELLDEMRQKVMGEMQPQKVKKLPSSTKSALGMFLGSPIAEGMTAPAILSNQQALQGAPQNVSRGTQRTGQKSTLGGLKQLNLGQRAATETTNLEEAK